MVSVMLVSSLGVQECLRRASDVGVVSVQWGCPDC